MAKTIILKKSSVVGKIPVPGDLAIGEPAFNLADKKLFTKDAAGNVIVISDTSKMAFEKVDTVDSDGRDFGFDVVGLDRATLGYKALNPGELNLVWGDDKMTDKGMGQFSIGVGYNLKGTGYANIASGWDNYCNSNYAIVTGISNTTAAPGGQLVAGVCLDATNTAQGIVCGSANEIPASSGLYALQVGNGTYQANPLGYANLQPGDRAYVPITRSDAFRVYHDEGVAEAPSCTNANIDTVGAKALVTKEYGDAHYLSSQNQKVIGEVLTLLAGEDNTTLVNQGIENTLQVYRNGLRLTEGIDYTYTFSSKVILFDRDALSTDNYLIDYEY